MIVRANEWSFLNNIALSQMVFGIHENFSHLTKQKIHNSMEILTDKESNTHENQGMKIKHDQLAFFSS